jgi:hypothetical protein
VSSPAGSAQWAEEGADLLDEHFRLLEDNVAHPLAPFLYSISTLHCLTISLAHGGAGLGTAWGEQLACKMLRDAGFREVTMKEVPNEPINALFVALK